MDQRHKSFQVSVGQDVDDAEYKMQSIKASIGFLPSLGTLENFPDQFTTLWEGIMILNSLIADILKVASVLLPNVAVTIQSMATLPQEVRNAIGVLEGRLNRVSTTTTEVGMLAQALDTEQESTQRAFGD